MQNRLPVRWTAGPRLARVLVLNLFVLAALGAVLGAEPKPELLEARKIWDAAPHNAFTDLTRFQGRWFCVFREGQGHVSPDGKLRVLTSTDGGDWSSTALLEHPAADLRDAKIVVTPEQQLMLTGAAALHSPAAFKHETLAWFSKDGRNWTEPVRIGEPNRWLWRVTWSQGRAYSVGYETSAEKQVRLYASSDGVKFETLVPTLFDQGYPNETALVFLPDKTVLCLLRRDGEPNTAKLGHAQPPYHEWDWKDLGVRIGGPNMIRLPDGRLVAAVRLYDGTVRTSLAWIDPNSNTLTECLRLPSGGDTSYAGLVWHDNLLWVSYYSSHETKSSIYLAKIKIP